MIISEKPSCKKVTANKIDDNTFEFVEVYDLSHPECPIVLIGGSAEVLENRTEKMIISEKPIMQLIDLFKIALEDNLTRFGHEEANNLLKEIESQQSEELKNIE